MRIAAKLTFVFILFSSLAGAQTIIHGKVTDASNNKALSGTAIIYLQDSTGVTADENGNFSIEVSDLPATLLFSYVGYKTYQVNIQNEKFINARLVVDDAQLNEVIVTATNFTDKLIEVPAAISLIPKEHLQRNDESFIMPAINRVPGLFMESGSLNTNRIAIRGIGSRTQYGTNSVKVYFNDIPLTSAEGESTIEDIDINALQRIEIIKGPSSGIYGAGLGGTINMIAETPQSLETTVNAKLVVGSYGLRNKHISLLHGTENGYLSIGVNDIKSDGYRSNSEYTRRSAIINGQLIADEKLSISFIGSFIDLKAYIPSSINYETFKNTPSAADSGWYNAKGYEQYIKSIIGISSAYTFSENFENHTSVFISFRDADEPRPFDILKQNSVASGVRTRFQYKNLSEKNFNLQFGAELFGDWFKWSTYDNLYQSTPGRGSVLGSILSDNKENRNYYNIFTQFQWYPFNKLKVEGGLNYNKTSYELLDLYTNDNIDQTGSYQFDAVISPRISLLYSIKDSWKLFGVASHGFSMPTLATTLTPEGLINTNIKPETGINYELGTKGSWFSGQLSGEISVYRIVIDNLLVDERIGPDQYIGLNAGESVHDGVELSLSFDKNIKNVQLNTFLSFTATNYKFTDFINNDIDYSGKHISGFPSNILNVGFDLKSDAGFYFLSDYRMVGESAMNDENSLYTKLYSLLNLKAGYLFDIISNFEIDVNGGVNNILDERYASMILVNAVGFGGNAPRYYYPGTPVNYYGSITLSYKF